jgi:arylsulfatase A
MKQQMWKRISLLLLTGLVLSGCGGGSSAPAANNPTPQSPPAPPPPPPVQNVAPTTDAGTDFTVRAGTTIALGGAVSDDGLPNPPAMVSVTWSSVSGPGNVNFTDTSDLQTNVSFDAPGDYVLQLTADDSALTHSDEVVVVVEVPLSTLAATDDIFEGRAGQKVSGDVLTDNGNGPDLISTLPVSAVLASNVAHGQLSWSGSGTFEFTPDTDFVGEDGFSYTLTDESRAESNIAAVVINIAEPVSGKPNVLYFLADDMGWGDLRHYNAQSKIEMPNLERLANEGIRFTDAHTAASKCAPSRYSALTGNYQWRGRWGWGQWLHKGGSQIRDGQQTLGDMLQSAGYVTASIGKLHLGGHFYEKGSNKFARSDGDDSLVDFSRRYKRGPLETGFDYSFNTLRGIQTWPYAYFENDRLVGSPNNLMIWNEGKYGGSTINHTGIGMPYWESQNVGPDLVQAAIDFIDDHHKTNLDAGTSTPFFMYYASQSAHGPYTPPDSILGEPVAGVTQMTRHTDMIYEIDVALGALISALEERGLADNTLIVFTSDNGGLPNDRNFGHDSVGGLRGKKGQIHEGGHRVPLIFKWGDGTDANSIIKPGTQTTQLAAIQDIVATVAEAVGVSVEATQAVDSLSMLPVLLGERPDNNRVRKTLIMEADEDDSGHVPRHFAIRDHSWKLIFDGDKNPMELYELSGDRNEKNNRINDADQKERIKVMTNRLNAITN